MGAARARLPEPAILAGVAGTGWSRRRVVAAEARASPTQGPNNPEMPEPVSMRVGVWAAGCLLAFGAIAAAASAGLSHDGRDDPPASAPGPAAPGAPASASSVPEIKRSDREAVVYLKDGHSYTGILVDRTEEHVVLRIAGINATFKAEQVDRVKVMPSIEDQYADMRKATDERDVDQMLRLVDWLTARQQLDMAALELDALNERVPDNPVVARAKLMLTRQIELRDRARAARERRGATGDADQEAPAHAPPPAHVPTLTADQIALIKVYEVDLKRPPRMDVPRAAMEAAMDANIGHPLVPATREGRDAILAKPFVEQLDFLFRLRARDQYGKVRVLDQPRSVQLFRDDVQRTWLAGSCATTACHGGTEAGRLVLAARKPNSDASVYTNLYIMERFRLADGTPLIDLEQPERSPLIQMGLPRDQSKVRHRPVPNPLGGRDRWRPAFRGLDDPRIRAAKDWIAAMQRPRPDLPFTYTPLRPFEAPKAPKAPEAPEVPGAGGPAGHPAGKDAAPTPGR